MASKTYEREVSRARKALAKNPVSVEELNAIGRRHAEALDRKFREMAQHMGNTIGETESYQRTAGYSDHDIAWWRNRKDRADQGTE